jgi:manganese transport protein
VAILPALVVILIAGQHSGWDETAIDQRLLELLILSQVILSLQLPFAIIPLLQVTGDSRQMGQFANRGWLKLLAWVCAIIVVGLNAVLICMQIATWANDAAEDGINPAWVYGTLGPIAIATGGFLIWIAVYPLRGRRFERPAPAAVPALSSVRYRRIGVGVELEGGDGAVLAQAVALARSHGAELLAMHVVEGPTADIYGAEADDRESREDRRRISELAESLRQTDLQARGVLGFGNPADELVRLVKEEQIDLLVLGAHGHRFIADMALGQTVSPVLHRLTIPVLVVPSGARNDQAPMTNDQGMTK